MIHHLDCGLLHAPPLPPASCHCLLLERDGVSALVDTGIGLQDIAHPHERIGAAAIAAAGFRFHEALTAVRQIERLGRRAEDVRDIVLTHADADHVGGLADFPAAAVHLSAEEHAEVVAGKPRYSAAQFAHGPRWVVHAASDTRWFGLEARRFNLSVGLEAYLVPLFGHTLGHCGVAVRDGGRWLLHVGDAYYLRAELESDEHPVSELARLRAEDDDARRRSLGLLRKSIHEHGSEVDLCGYHDRGELPSGGQSAGA
jgi:glyoxylase-like metal-dependent hydrolase (beta-lactamase superfamily II)